MSEDAENLDVRSAGCFSYTEDSSTSGGRTRKIDHVYQLDSQSPYEIDTRPFLDSVVSWSVTMEAGDGWAELIGLTLLSRTLHADDHLC